MHTAASPCKYNFLSTFPSFQHSSSYLASIINNRWGAGEITRGRWKCSILTSPAHFSGEAHVSGGDNITRTQAVKLPPPFSSTSRRCLQLYSPRWQMKTSLWPSAARLSSFQSVPLNSAAHSVICSLVCQVIWKWQTVEMWWHAGSETTSVLRLYVSFFFFTDTVDPFFWEQVFFCFFFCFPKGIRHYRFISFLSGQVWLYTICGVLQ